MLQNFKLNTPLRLHTHALFPHLQTIQLGGGRRVAAFAAFMPERNSQPLGYCSGFGARVCWGWERSPLSKGMQMSRVHLTSFHDPCRPQPPQPAGAVCHILDRAVALPLALERGNGSVQSFTSTALRLTESIKEDRPPRSPCAHPFSFLSALSICPNYFCLGCQRRFLAKGDRAEINSEHVGSSLFTCQFQ